MRARWKERRLILVKPGLPSVSGLALLHCRQAIWMGIASLCFHGDIARQLSYTPDRVKAYCALLPSINREKESQAKMKLVAYTL